MLAVGWAVPISTAGKLIEVFSGTAHPAKMFALELMSRRDNLHLSLRRTLEKDGWTITDDPLILVLEQTL